jgi:hypothetical protein
MVTLARSHVFSSHARSLIVSCNVAVGCNVPKSISWQGIAMGVLPVLSCGVSILLPASDGVTQEQRCFLVKGMGHHCLGRCRSLIDLESLLMDPLPMPSFWPIAGAIDWICIIDHVKVTVLDGMNLFCVHDKAI